MAEQDIDTMKAARQIANIFQGAVKQFESHGVGTDLIVHSLLAAAARESVLRYGVEATVSWLRGAANAFEKDAAEILARRCQGMN